MSDYEPKCKKTLPIIFDDRMPASNLTPKLVSRVNDNTEDLKNLYEETESQAEDIETLQEDLEGKIDVPSVAGTSGQVLTSDGEGGAVWASVGAGEIVVDPTLTVEGAAADAKKTGDEITHLKQDNDELKTSLNQNYANTIAVEQGYWAVADGTPALSATWCRTNKFVGKEFVVKTTTTFMWLLAFNNKTSEYVGTWNGTQFSTVHNSGLQIREYNIALFVEQFPDYMFAIDFYQGSGITPSDIYSEITVYDYTVSKANTEITNIKNAINQDETDIGIHRSDKIISDTDYVPFEIPTGAVVTFYTENGELLPGGNIYLYDSSKTQLDYFSLGSTYGNKRTVTYNKATASYVRLQNNYTNGIRAVWYDYDEFWSAITKDGCITTNLLAEKSVSLEKCSFTAHDPMSNYVDTSKITNGYIIQENGTPKATIGFAITDYCEVTEGDTLYAYHLLGGYCAFYDSTKTLLPGKGYDYGEISFPMTVPTGAVYARFTSNTGWWADTSQIWLFTQNEKPKNYAVGITAPVITDVTDENPCDYDGDEISVFNKCLCVGDSMTSGTFNYVVSGTTYYDVYAKYSYPTYLKKITGMEVTNLGIGGYTSVEWWNAEQNADLSGYDVAIIQLGINDCLTYTTLGNDSKTAFANIINKLKTQNNNIKIFVANIVPASSYSSSAMIAFSDELLEWVQTAYSSDANVIPLDIQQFGHTNDSPAYNCGHLSALGYHRLAMDYKNYISWYINKNKMVFQQVQFIGTDKSYPAG